VDEARRVAIAERQDQSGRVEVRPGKYKLLEQLCRHRLHDAPLRRLAAPNLG